MDLTFGKTTSTEDAFRLAAIIDSSNDAIIGKTLDGIITSWNSAAVKMLGFTEDEIVGKHVAVILPEDEIGREKEILTKISLGQKIESFEATRLSKSGNVIQVALTISPVKNSRGDIIGASTIARDITEQKLAERKNAMLAAIVDSSDDGIISKDLDGIITSWNKAAEKIFGYREEEVIGKHITILFPEERHHEEEIIIGKVKSGERLEHFETVRKRKDGFLIDVSLTVSPVRDTKGNIIGVSKIVRNITEQKLAKERDARLAAIVNSSDDAIISKDLRGYITSWNKGAQQIFGYTQEEIVGKHITILLPKDRLHEEELILGRIRQGEKIEHFQTIRKTREGVNIHVSLTVSPVKDEHGTVIGVSKIARNITEFVVSQQRLEAYAAELKRLNSYKDEFISMASHELNTPLTSLRVYLQILRENLLKQQSDESNTNFVNKALNLSEKLGKLIGDLLDVSKIEAGKLQLNMNPFNLTAIIEEALDSMRAITKKHEIIYEGFTGEVMVNGDKDRMEQVLINVLSNAIKYSPKADKVIMKAAVIKKDVVITIQDFGIGIPRAQIGRIFSRFFRAEGLPSSFSGLGIGLYLSHQIVIRHSGEMKVESEEGVGTTFTIVLPVQYSPSGAK